jgi:hypothetical protein
VQLMRIGPASAEKPVARIDVRSYVDLSDVVRDFDEAFFGNGGLERVEHARDAIAGYLVVNDVSERAFPHRLTLIDLLPGGTRGLLAHAQPRCEVQTFPNRRAVVVRGGHRTATES